MKVKIKHINSCIFLMGVLSSCGENNDDNTILEISGSKENKCDMSNVNINDFLHQAMSDIGQEVWESPDPNSVLDSLDVELSDFFYITTFIYSYENGGFYSYLSDSCGDDLLNVVDAFRRADLQRAYTSLKGVKEWAKPNFIKEADQREGAYFAHLRSNGLDENDDHVFLCLDDDYKDVIYDYIKDAYTKRVNEGRMDK